MSNGSPRNTSPSRWENKVFTGGWQATATSMDIVEPATGDVIARVGEPGLAEIEQAARSAAAAQPAWEATSFEVRATVLRKVARLLEERFAEIAEWIVRETGSGRFKAQFELGVSIRAVNEAAAMPSQPCGMLLPSDRSRLSFARRRAIGVCGIISPFNFPFFLSIRAVSPALAVGNSVLLKPNPCSTLSGGLLIAELFEEAGLPPGLLHVIPGGAAAGEAICSSPAVNMIQFTGSTSTGRRIGEVAGKHLKKVSLEMGGKNPLIVLDDADIETATAGAAFASFMHQGQICFAAGRTLVHESIADAFAARLVERARNIRMGNPATEDVLLGPMINAAQVQRVERIVNASVAAGAKLLTGGTANGLFYPPTVLADVAPGMPAWDEEVFGPVACITRFSRDEDAVAMANATEYGLSGAVMSASVSRALAIGEQLRVGILHINDQTVAEEVVNPISGWGASGNGTGIGGTANWEEFSNWQWVTIKDAVPPYPIG